MVRGSTVAMRVPVCTCRRKTRALSFLSQPLLSQISPHCHGALPYSQSPRASSPFLDQVHPCPGTDESPILFGGLTLPSTPILSLPWSFPPPCPSPSLITWTIPANPSCIALGHHLQEAPRNHHASSFSLPSGSAHTHEQHWGVGGGGRGNNRGRGSVCFHTCSCYYPLGF